MSSKSNDQGRAYEYAWMITLKKALGNNAHICENSSLETNKCSWNNISTDLQQLFLISSQAAIDTILEIEPLMSEKTDDFLSLEFQIDKAGENGDVRDIIIKRKKINWEIGLSIKHNNNAIKHSRLSKKIDFGKKWFKTPCSKNYWNDVNPIFDILTSLELEKKKWRDIDYKFEKIYKPIVTAFMDEINRSYKKTPDLPKKIVEYLIGSNDYYKIESQDSKYLTIIQTFNTHGTLNKPGKYKVSTITVPIVELPTEIIKLRLKPKSQSTIEMYFNNGWQLSFRIHSCSTFVSPSLKFDVQFIGMPSSILTMELHWKK